MKNEVKSTTQILYQTLIKQNEILGEIIAQQRLLRSALRDKQSLEVEKVVQGINVLAGNFAMLEEKRLEYCMQLHSDEPNDMFLVSKNLPLVFKKPIIEIFHQIRQKLAVSKIENDAISEYVRITKNFLQGVFETALPQQRNVRYSESGSIIKLQPESVVLNTII